MLEVEYLEGYSEQELAELIKLMNEFIENKGLLRVTPRKLLKALEEKTKELYKELP